MRFAVKRDALSQNVLRGAKFAMPKSVAEDGHRTSTRLVFFWTKRAAQNRLQAESRQKFRRNHVDVNALGLAGAGHVVVVGPEGAQGSEGMIVFLPVEEIRICDGAFLERGRLGVNSDEFVGIRKRKRIEQ